MRRPEWWRRLISKAGADVGPGREDSEAGRSGRMSGACAALVTVLAGLLAFGASPALAAESGPQWTVTAVSNPTNFPLGDHSGDNVYKVTVTNTGGTPSDGSVITVTDTMPEGLTLAPAGASGVDQISGNALSCVGLTCTYSGSVVADDFLTITIPVDIAGNTSAETNTVTVSGGGAAPTSVSTPTTISSIPAGFGIAPGSATTVLSSAQAGGHADLTTSIAFNTVTEDGVLAGAPKNTTDNLPPGFAGDLVDTPSCPVAAFSKITFFQPQSCPLSTQVGTVALGVRKGQPPEETFTVPLDNLAPGPGQTAKLGFVADIFGVQGEVSVRPGDYGLETTFQNTPEAQAELDRVSLTVWGVPGDPSHDAMRGLVCNGAGNCESCNSTSCTFPATSQSSNTTVVPFLTNPTECTGAPLTATFSANSWEQPEQTPVSASMSFGPLSGCDRLEMNPSLTIQPTTARAYAPTGLDLGMTIPQTYSDPEGLATSTLKRAVVTLPEGITVNPSAGAGLGACTEAQYREEAAQFVPGDGCPNESKLGEVSIVTPALKEPITGSVFLAQPYKNPFNSLLALYIVARLPERGIIIKAAGEIAADPLTGRLVTTFDNLPPLPFSTFTFKFHLGVTSPLVTPPVCGSYTVQAELTPWANPGGFPLTPVIPPFEITTGFDGGPCPSGGAAPFAPQVQAGTLNNRAGAYSC